MRLKEPKASLPLAPASSGTCPTRRRGPKPNPETRNNLLKSGVRLLHGTGYGATGIQDIVGAAEVPKGSFYNHFPSKEAFGAEAVDLYFGEALPKLQAELTAPDTAPLDRLRNYFTSRIKRFKKAGYARGCMLGNLSLEVADHSPAIRTRLSTHFQTWSGLFEQCIEQAQASGAIRNSLPAEVLANHLLDAWEGALLRMRAERSAEPLERFMAVTFQCLLI
jgi:TetR/AcrR family transcriptional repressor of nem operon